MEKVIDREKIKKALQARGWTQKDLARELGVTAQAVTNWLKGTDFPRPNKLLKLATTLKLGFADLVVSSVEGQPVIAFRKKGAAKTTDAHILKAVAMQHLFMLSFPIIEETLNCTVIETILFVFLKMFSPTRLKHCQSWCG